MSKNKNFEILKYTTIFFFTTTIGSWIILKISANFDIKIFEKSHASELNYTNKFDLLNIFIIAPIFETLLIFLFFKFFKDKLNFIHFILIAALMGVVHEYYRNGALFPLIWVFYVMSYGYFFMLKYGKIIAFFSIAIIHAAYNFCVINFF